MTECQICGEYHPDPAVHRFNNRKNVPVSILTGEVLDYAGCTMKDLKLAAKQAKEAAILAGNWKNAQDNDPDEDETV